MKKLFLILLFSTSLYSSDYYFSFYGSGEKVSNLNPSNISLGWSNLFNANSYTNIGSLSNFYSSDLVRLSMATDLNFYLIDNVYKYSQKMLFFSFLFPIQKTKKSLGFSMSPYYRVNSDIIESEYNYLEGYFQPGNDNELGTEDDIYIDPLAYRSKYSFSGGPTIASLLFSSKINNNFSFGMKLNYIFGSIYSYIEHNRYRIVYDDYDYTIDGHELQSTDFFTLIKNYKGYGFELEGSFQNTKNRLSASFSMSNKLKVNQFFYDDIVPENLELNSNYNEVEDSYFISSPFELNIGFARFFDKKRSFIMEYYLYSPYQIDFNSDILDNSDLNKQRISIGYYRPILDDKLILSTGLYFVNSSNDIISSSKQGITFGLGFNMIKYISVDTCLEIGKNKLEMNELLDANYINLYLGLSTSDRWFK